LAAAAVASAAAGVVSAAAAPTGGGGGSSSPEEPEEPLDGLLAPNPYLVSKGRTRRGPFLSALAAKKLL
jgi:hypothetical protein